MDNNDKELIRNAVSVKDGPRRRLLMVLGLIFVVCLLGGAAAAGVTYFTLKSAAKDGTVLAQQIQQECMKPGITDPDLAQFCPSADDVVESAPQAVKVSEVPGPEGPQGDQGEQGTEGAVGDDGPPPSATQVLSAVRRFCEDTGRCDGSDGADATPAQVAIAVSSYCNSRGQCRGPAGTSGADGTNGADGANGKDAPPVTQAQLIQAVDTYCSLNNNCRGPAGSDGKNGENGTDGQQGPPGVINVADNCEAAPDGMVLDDVNVSYDPSSQTVIIDCTYRDSSIIPPE